MKGTILKNKAALSVQCILSPIAWGSLSNPTQDMVNIVRYQNQYTEDMADRDAVILVLYSVKFN